MEYEIGNPSDQCFISSDDPRVAAACILFLGNGQYFCIDTSSGEQVPGSFFAMGGDVEETWQHFHGIGFDEFMAIDDTREKMAECYESFRYSAERSSMNNIGKRAREFANAIRKPAAPLGE